MTDRSSQTPIYVDAMALCQWLCERFDTASHPLESRLLGAALDLLLTLTMALKGRGREARIEEADEHLIGLRTLLRLAVECGRLTPEQYAHVLGRIDAIGRQIGAWQRSLGPL